MKKPKIIQKFGRQIDVQEIRLSPSILEHYPIKKI